VLDYCQTILEKECRVGRAALTPFEAECYLLYRSVSELENGGLSGLLYNISPDWDYLAELAEVLEKKGELQLAALVREAHSIVVSGPTDFRGTWSGWLDLADPDEKLQRIGDSLFPKHSLFWRHLEGAVPKRSKGVMLYLLPLDVSAQGDSRMAWRASCGWNFRGRSTM
jgi:hypothetical protein